MSSRLCALARITGVDVCCDIPSKFLLMVLVLDGLQESFDSKVSTLQIIMIDADNFLNEWSVVRDEDTPIHSKKIVLENDSD